MAGVKPYWHGKANESVPFYILLNLLEAYCHPEVRAESYELLKARARKSRPDDEEMQQFKVELAALLRGERDGLHPQAITQATWYDDEDSDTEFLAKIWSDLYPDEPIPSHH
ncbi:hypothetical protein [Kribbella deserti]|uniref:Uncharacterized protein n=1 Tax=Kribbella deserti TaxID=1926257 RepID=A0ABV6QJ58_9ACTN